MSVNSWHFWIGIVCLVYLFFPGTDTPSQGNSGPMDCDRSATNDPLDAEAGDLLDRDQQLYGTDGLDGFDRPHHIVADDEPGHRPV